MPTAPIEVQQLLAYWQPEDDSDTSFAGRMGVAVKTWIRWKQGENRPSAAKLEKALARLKLAARAAALPSVPANGGHGNGTKVLVQPAHGAVSGQRIPSESEVLHAMFSDPFVVKVAGIAIGAKAAGYADRLWDVILKLETEIRAERDDPPGRGRAQPARRGAQSR